MIHALFINKLGRAEKILLETLVNFCDVVFSDRGLRATKEVKLLLGTALTTLQALDKSVRASMVEYCEIVENKIKKCPFENQSRLSLNVR